MTPMAPFPRKISLDLHSRGQQMLHLLRHWNNAASLTCWGGCSTDFHQSTSVSWSLDADFAADSELHTGRKVPKPYAGARRRLATSGRLDRAITSVVSRWWKASSSWTAEELTVSPNPAMPAPQTRKLQMATV